jgi:lipoprotein NlpI
MRYLLLTLIAFSALAADQKSPRALVEQGMAEFRAGKVAESIESFESAAKQQPSLRPHLWQLGISLYYAGEFEKGRKLFESHQTVNPQDVENAVWHYLCLSRTDGVAAARKRFIPITDDRRIPMKEIHGLFAGTHSKEDVLAAAKAGNPSDSELKDRLFYAHLYIGLFEEAEKHSEESLKHMKLAATDYTQPHYMGSVARVHVKLRSR